MAHAYDLLTASELRRKACNKWRRHPEGTLPLWVADMDFPVAATIKDAIAEQLAVDNLGYPPRGGLPGIREAVSRHLATRFDWQVDESHIEPISGIVAGLDLACKVLSENGAGVAVQTPIYPPFLSVISRNGRRTLHNVMKLQRGQWEIDIDDLSAQVQEQARLLMFCNPHNPTGRVFTRAELERVAELVLRHDLYVVSDELHADLTYPGHQHIPFASIDAEVASRTLTLYGPTKAFNIAGLKIGFLIAQNEQLRQSFKDHAGHLFSANVLGQAAAIAAFERGHEWLRDTLAYLRGNRDYLAKFIKSRLGGIGHVPPQGTYLAWLDFSGLGIGDELYPTLLERCKVALNDGPLYGPGGDGFARLNFATSRGILQEALERLERGLEPHLEWS